MRQMKQRADEGLLRQKTPDARGGAEMNAMNQISALVLPLVSDSKRLMWVQSNQINLQLDGATELEKAFDRFPYLKEDQTAALAQRCSLHPDQVRVWFIVQRLRYGISWDYKDILNVRRKLKASRGKEELQKGRGENNKFKREVKERKMKQEQPLKENKDRKVELEEDKSNTQKKRKRVTVKDKIAKKSRVDEGVVERAGELNSDEVKKTVFTRMKKKAKINKRLLSDQVWPDHKSLVVQDETLDVLPSLIPLTQTQAQTPDTPSTPVRSGFKGKAEMEAKLDGETHAASKNPNVTDVGRPKVLVNLPNNPVVADGSARVHFHTKTRSQLETMKGFFSNCQYPDNGDYDLLATLVGLPRSRLVQWFADMRYYVKKLKPSWLTQEQHQQALANIRYRQYLSTLARALKLERSGGRGEQESVQVPPEKK
ncbi:homeobox and leucine zipper encoding b [Pagrus major]|uniref:homeobox and leucine zipper encoding b n=1 Tax=Pagrus major TaxID=143350 RepID=UPI003CC8D4CE